jgi:hypothetical protein
MELVEVRESFLDPLPFSVTEFYIILISYCCLSVMKYSDTFCQFLLILSSSSPEVRNWALLGLALVHVFWVFSMYNSLYMFKGTLA